ncbi:phage baseplate protein [Paenibacillus chungangensis]|uniref:P68 RBP/TagC-like beta-propeller domain-containing protein n=1 Tax=Paenibacillus chungangensis TaxID=696535 RepID=A0ABW3HR37_9BACL
MIDSAARGQQGHKSKYKASWMTVLLLLLMWCLLSSSASQATAERDVLHSKVFNLAGGTSELMRGKALHNNTVMQSLAFDNVNGHVYIVQLMAGGQQLPDEPAPVSGSVRARNGDLTLTQLDLAGNELGHMFLRGFGHGVQIGVESTEDGRTYLWTESDSVTEGKDGWGTQLARFAFDNGAIYDPGSPQLEKFRLKQGVDRTTVTIDQAHGLLTMRYRENGTFRFGVYRLEDIANDSFTPIADVPQPSMGTFQGFASYGGYLYVLEGNAYGSNGSTVPLGNTYITSVDLNTGEVVQRERITGSSDILFREPEGMAISIPDMRHPHKAQLSFGFASTVSETNKSKLANVLYLDELTPVQALKD